MKNFLIFFQKIFCKHVHNIEGIAWSPGSRLFTIWSSMLTDNAIGIYSIEESKWLSYFKPIYTYPNLSGVRKVQWSFSGQFLAVIDLLDTVKNFPSFQSIFYTYFKKL